jgi:two-component system chemotaxis response regulator CheY
MAAIEADLLAIEKCGAQIDEELVNRVLSAIHSVETGTNMFELVKIRELAHRMKEAVSQVRTRKIVATPHRVRILLRAADRLNELLGDPGSSNGADITGTLSDLAGLGVNEDNSAAPGRRASLRALLVEDNFASRLLLQTFLSRYGECHVAVNGREAVEAFHSALEAGQSYDLVCMDIMMPEMDGREAVRRIREMEEARGILSSSGTKIIMTTAVDEIKDVVRCFKELCDAYLVKPIDLGELLSHMRSHQLVP